MRVGKLWWEGCSQIGSACWCLCLSWVCPTEVVASWNRLGELMWGVEGEWLMWELVAGLSDRRWEKDGGQVPEWLEHDEEEELEAECGVEPG